MLPFGALALLGCAATGPSPKSAAETASAVEIQFIRSATVAIKYKNLDRKSVTILVDPILADKGTEPPIDFSNTNKNPTIELPVDKKQLLESADAILITHYHPDHFDLEAERIVPRDTLIFCQPYDEARLREKGFSNLQVIDRTFTWKGITISRLLARHHEGAVGAPPFGESSSYSLQTKKEALFFTGDAILDDRLRAALTSVRPNVIVANTGECQFTKENPVLTPGTPMTLTVGELKEMTQLLPRSKVVAVHMDAINHCQLTKDGLRKYVASEHLKGSIVVPTEGDVMAYDALMKN
ncbi:putative exported protein [Labilithrix luteola]|uniref:Putative exported protein n=2 Tax=Labilithrix luteola TaxID=1391654 RepID=A0A0K1QG48_9BACT|nr:putative exported protein [Labilithrix luteola]